MSKQRVLIVDDEPLARGRIRQQVEAIEGYEVAGEAESGLQAIEMAASTRADILLLDIRMPGMNGLEVGRHLSTTEHPPAVIFTTAYSEHALEAFQAHAVDYLLKPVREEKLAAALVAARKLSRAQMQKVDEELDSGRRSHICARVRGDLQLINVTDIYYFKADSKYVEVRHTDGTVLIEESLVTLEKEFEGDFFRVHRNALVASAYVDGLQKGGDGHSYVHMSGITETVEISRRHLPAVRALLKNKAPIG